MGKRRKNKRYYKKEELSPEQKVIAAGIITTLVLLILFWILFTLFIILSLVLIFFLIHKLSEKYGLYNSDYYSGAIGAYFIGGLISLVILLAVGVNLGKIDTTFMDWAKTGSSYVTVKNKGGNPTMGVNLEGTAQQAIITQIPEGDAKRVATLSNEMTDQISQSIRDSFVRLIKNIFSSEQK